MASLPTRRRWGFGDCVGELRQRSQRGVVAGGADPDQLAVGAVDLPAADRHPGGERGVQLGQRGNVRPARTWSRPICTCRSTRPFPVGR